MPLCAGAASAFFGLTFTAPGKPATPPTCDGAPATIVGSPRADKLTGTPGPDVFVGRGGNDVIKGGGGGDRICGGPGDDHLLGGGGHDVLLAGSGNDVVFGGRDSDFIAGEAGRDRLYGGPGTDTCSQSTGTGSLAGCEIVVSRAVTLPPSSPLRSDAEATALIRRRRWEPRQENTTANRTIPTGPVAWSNAPDTLYWKKWIVKRNRVTGRFTGTTDEIIQWASYKWGFDEDLTRAIAAEESEWTQSTVGDGGESFGLMQVKDHYDDGSIAFGGYPWTQRATALNVDFTLAMLRACYDGDFYDGSGWLYGSTQIKGDLWGCVGSWFSGDWYDTRAKRYIAEVKAILAARPWRHWS